MSVRISFLGDVSLNNGYSSINEKGENPFSDIEKELINSDYTVGNLEAFLEGDDGFNQEKKPYLYAPKGNYELLRFLPVNLFTLANNHVFDTFLSGYVKSVNKLNELDIKSFGVSINQDEDCHIFTTTIKSKSFCFLNYCHKDTNPKLPSGSNVQVSTYNAKSIINAINQNKQKFDFLVLCLHWGGRTDYGHYPESYQRSDAKKFIDCGADAIIGHHAHCIQPIEMYKSKPIIYCLGNFCFDDINSHGNIYPIRKTGLRGYLVHLDFSSKGIRVNVKNILNKKLFLEIKNVGFNFKWLNFKYWIFSKIPFFNKFQRFYLRVIEPKIFYLNQSDKSLIQIILSLKISKIKEFLKT